MGTMLAMSNGIGSKTGCTAAAEETNAQIATQFDISQYLNGEFGTSMFLD
jgi:hypothetical protein